MSIERRPGDAREPVEQGSDSAGRWYASTVPEVVRPDQRSRAEVRREVADKIDARLAGDNSEEAAPADGSSNRERPLRDGDLNYGVHDLRDQA
ncbi:hypothetical protein [Polymorphospora rubra]|uniref:hypothetical protein n=1 Tax=Polymorphospora rubra TaxID=338584 RepID=UPI0033FCAF1D